MGRFVLVLRREVGHRRVFRLMSTRCERVRLRNASRKEIEIKPIRMFVVEKRRGGMMSRKIVPDHDDLSTVITMNFIDVAAVLEHATADQTSSLLLRALVWRSHICRRVPFSALKITNSTFCERGIYAALRPRMEARMAHRKTKHGKTGAAGRAHVFSLKIPVHSVFPAAIPRETKSSKRPFFASAACSFSPDVACTT